MFKKWDWRYGSLTILFCIGACISYIYQDRIILSIKIFFEIPCLPLLSGIVVTIVTIVHKIKTRKLVFTSTMSFSQFKIPFEDFFTPVTFVCSISLAKGLFLQYYFDTKYFPFFHGITLFFIGIVTIYLMYIAIMEFAKNIQDIFTSPENQSGIVSAITEEEFKKNEGETN